MSSLPSGTVPFLPAALVILRPHEKRLTVPSVLRGAGRLLDLSGALSTYKQHSTIDHEEIDYEEAAYDALRGAWRVLGADLRTVMEQERRDNPALQGVEPEREQSVVAGDNDSTSVNMDTQGRASLTAIG